MSEFCHLVVADVKILKFFLITIPRYLTTCILMTGRNIWSLAVNQSEDLIVTGGGDGSIRLWPLFSSDQYSRTTSTETCLPSDNTASRSQKTNKKDYPRYVSLLDQSNLLVMTNEG